MPRSTLTFRLEKETKNTVRYAEQERPDGPPIIGTLYVQKFAARAADGAGFAASLTVTVDTAEAVRERAGVPYRARRRADRDAAKVPPCPMCGKVGAVDLLSWRPVCLNPDCPKSERTQAGFVS
jgi:hypothetical protein